MANPSLQIGNSNWAIKEDNLLGYSTAGTRFVPQPITMTRESAGTRVNSSGLVETVELLGSEEITNGDFATDSNWSKNTGWTISGGTANKDSVDTNYLTQDFSGNGQFKITYTISGYVSGDVRLRVGTGFSTIIRTSNGTYTEYITKDSASFGFYGVGEFSIDNVSVKESTKNNLARVDYDGTASSLLVEPQRTNLVTYSEDFSRAVGLIALSIELNQGISPNGLTVANLLSVGVDASATRHRLYNLYSFVSGDTYTYSLFAKKNEQDWFQLMFSSSAFDTQSYANFDLNNGAVGNTGTSTTANIIDYGNGWYKCSITCTATASTSTTYEILTTNNTDSGRYPSYQSTTSVNVCYLWGGSLEEGSYATSYIPTNGEAGGVTRVRDQYSKTGISNLINSEEGVFFLETALFSDENSNKYISISDGTSGNNIVQIDLDYSSSQLQYLVKSGGGVQCNLRLAYTGTNMDKIAIKWKENDFAVWLNGVEIGTDTSGLAPIGLTTIKLSAYDDGNYFEGKVKQLQVFKTALTDSELATLTRI